MDPDPLEALARWIHCPDREREQIRHALRGSVADVGAGGGSRIDPCSAVRVDALGPSLHVEIDRRFAGPPNGAVRVLGNLDGRPLPFRDAAFDAVACMHVLEHVNRPDDLVAELFRVARPGGWAFAAVPNGWSFSDNLYKLWKLVFLVSKSEPIPHVQRFGRRSVGDLFAAAGFEVRFVARLGETYEWLSKHAVARAVLTRATRALARLHADTFSYGWLFVLRKPG